MPKDYGSLRTPAARNIVLTIALLMGLSACGDAEWEKQGYESEEVFEQALAGGFQNPADFNAAQKYQVTTKSEWDALNKTVSDGGFASIDAMQEAAELGYSTQAAWDAALEQQAKEAGFASVAVMRKAQDLGYATQAEWDSAIERRRIEGILGTAPSRLAAVVACREMNDALISGDLYAIGEAVGDSGLELISNSYFVFELQADMAAEQINETLPEDAREEFGKMWRAEYKTLTEDFWNMGTTSKLAAYQRQCSERLQAICRMNKIKTTPDDLLQGACKRVGLR